jgi:hypothetical protein
MAATVKTTSSLRLASQAWLACLLVPLMGGCAAYLPISSQDIDEAERLERRITAEHPEMVDLLNRHQNGWFLDTTGTPGPVFNYGKSGDQYAGKDRQGRDIIAPVIDEYSRAELDHLAEVIAVEVKAMHFSRRVEFHDAVHHRTTYVITTDGRVKK